MNHTPSVSSVVSDVEGVLRMQEPAAPAKDSLIPSSPAVVKLAARFTIEPAMNPGNVGAGSVSPSGSSVTYASTASGHTASAGGSNGSMPPSRATAVPSGPTRNFPIDLASAS